MFLPSIVRELFFASRPFSWSCFLTASYCALVAFVHSRKASYRAELMRMRVASRAKAWIMSSSTVGAGRASWFMLSGWT